MRYVLGMTVFMGLLGSSAWAFESAEFPRMRLRGPAAVSYAPASELLTAESSIRGVRFAVGERLGRVSPDTSLELNLQVRRGQGLVGGGLGSDLVLRGAVDRDRDGQYDFEGVLLEGEWFPYTEIDSGRRTIRRPGETIPVTGEASLRFVPTGGELAAFFVGRDIVLEGADLEPGAFDMSGTLQAASTVRGACCEFPNICSEITELECDARNGGFAGVGSTCVVPATSASIGSHRLVGRPFGGLSDIGLVLNALDGDPNVTYVYQFDVPGAEVELQYDGSVARIAGTAVGGILDGGQITDVEQISFQFAYTQANEAAGAIAAADDVLAFGFIVRPNETVVLENGPGGLMIGSDGTLSGSVRYLFSNRGTMRMIQADLVEALSTCELLLGACQGFDGSCSVTSSQACDTLSGDFDGVGSTCEAEADSDGDGVPDSSDICPGGDDNIDTDMDGTPDFCDSDPGISNGGCCLPNGACIILNEEECGQFNGAYQGNGSSCFDCN